GAAVGERHQPAARASLTRVEAGRGAPDVKQHLLRDLFGLRRVLDDPADEAVDDRAEPVVHRGEGRFVAARDLCEQPGQFAGGCRARPLARQLRGHRCVLILTSGTSRTYPPRRPGGPARWGVLLYDSWPAADRIAFRLAANPCR